jgi:hypothetical protein
MIQHYVFSFGISAAHAGRSAPRRGRPKLELICT